MAEAGAPASPFPSYPVSLDVRGRRCLVVGGGPVAARKARSLLECGALVTVIAPEVSPAFAALEPVTLEQRPYRAGDVTGFALVLTATGRPEIDGAVHADARAAGIWVNSADDLKHCTFTLPAVVRDGPVSVAVSTGGASPALASWLRSAVAAQVEGVGQLAALLSDARAAVKASGRSTEDIDWAALLDGSLPDLVRQGRITEATALLERAIATG
jgi:siroheme synthase-like protein